MTKSKIWKDIAGMLGIGASSSAAYTLRKHYTKNLFPFECHYDRGGVDPLPIIQQIESGSKKKAPKQVSAPSPDANHKGSSNSQDSFQGLCRYFLFIAFSSILFYELVNKIRFSNFSSSNSIATRLEFSING